MAAGCLLFALGCALFFWVRGGLSQKGQSSLLVKVSAAGEETSYSLDEDAKIPLGEGNLLCIENGEVFMQEADCPDQVCVRMGRIRRPGEMILCLPNQIWVRIEREEGQEIDGVVQ